MPHPIELLAEAADELLEARQWYERRDIDVARRFAESIDFTIRKIAENPLRWPLYRKNTRRCVLSKFPFSVIYLSKNQVVQIVAFAHAKRRPGYWDERIVK